MTKCSYYVESHFEILPAQLCGYALH